MHNIEKKRQMTSSTNKISRWLNTIDEHLEKSLNSFSKTKEDELIVNVINSTTDIAVESGAETAAAAWTSTELTPIAPGSFSSDGDSATKTAYTNNINTIQEESHRNDYGDTNNEEASSTDSWSLDDDEDEQDASIPIIANACQSSWELNELNMGISAASNCPGIIYVRLIKAIHLPNLLNHSTNNDVHAILAMPPWKGRIKSSKAKSSFTARRGLRVNWEKPEEQLTSCYAMVHNYNSEETPIPDILIDLISSSTINLAAAAALLLGTTSAPSNIFETYLCSFTISCLPIMQRPGQHVKRWFAATTYEEGSNGDALREDLKKELDFYQNKEPLILLELCFEPTGHSSQVNIPALPYATRPTDQVPLKQHEVEDEDDSATTHTTLSQYTTTPSVAGTSARHHHHLFRIKRFWIPAYCSVCSSLLIRRNAHRCEACKLDCCADCLISVDVLYPCGSNVAKLAVQHSLQNKLQIQNILEVIAPSTSAAQEKSHLISNNTEKEEPNSQILQEYKNQGIGVLKIRIHRAILFEKLYPPEAFLEDILDSYLPPSEDASDNNDDIDSKSKDMVNSIAAFKGDHYVRISWNRGKESVRTRTIYQTAKPVFDGEEIQICVPNYGTEYKIEVVDANNDGLVGCALLSTQMMLLWHYDSFFKSTNDESENLLRHLQKLLDARTVKVKPRKCILELRTGVKTGFGLDFYSISADKNRNPNLNVDKGKHEITSVDHRPGAISGVIELDVTMEEDLEHLMYSRSSTACPFRAPEDLNIELIQLHLSRIGNLLEGIKSFASNLAYIVSWKNPALTSLCMIIFTFSCFRFNVEYIGSLPFGALLIYMIYQYEVRRQGNNKRFWINKERDARIKAEKMLVANISVHRPIAQLRLIIERGKNIRSRELGLPGSLNASVTWIPFKNLSQRDKDRLQKYEATSPFYVGTTTNSGVTTNPFWRGVIQSDEVLKLQQLICDSKAYSTAGRNDNSNDRSLSLSQTWDESTSFFLPILQPVTLSVNELGDHLSSQPGLRLLPWERSSGSILIQVRFDNIFNKLLVFEDLLGEVEIPFSLLLSAETNENGEKVINRWFPLKITGGSDSMSFAGATTGSESPSAFFIGDDTPEIFVRARLMLPPTSTLLTDSEREMSAVVAEEIIRSSVASENKIGVIGNSINTLNTVGGLIGNIQMIQNQMGLVLDIVESALNSLTWAHPHRSFVIFIVVFAAFLALSIIPTRFLFFCGGIAPFIANFKLAYDGDRKDAVKVDSEPGSDSGVALAINFLNALPTNEDLRRIYFWEGKRIGERERQQLAKAKRLGRLTRLWNAHWYGTLEVQKSIFGRRKSERHWKWESVFVVVQGHRVVWWIDERQFDESEPPVGSILLSGHCGLGVLSPLDARELKGDSEIVIYIFGRGKNGQQKVFFRAETPEEKNEVDAAIIQAIEDKTH